MISRVCVFCGASDGARPEFRSAAVALGKALAAEGITLIYGGGRAGLMGAVADGCLLSGGKVIGVITKLLEGRELGHSGITSLHVVDTMHERKMMMANLADAFISLPGGLGTLDEMFEILAWAQLGIHDKPVGLLNTCNYYDGVMQFLDHVEREGFLRLNHRTAIVVESEIDSMLRRLRTADPHEAKFPRNH